MDPVTGTGPTAPGALGGAADSLGDDRVVEVIRHEEQLHVGTRVVEVERVRFVRRIVTETRMVPVQVRREVIDIDRSPLTGDPGSDSTMTTDRTASPVVMVLHEEYPQITLGIRAVEQITATVTRVTGQTVVHAEVSTE